MSRSVRIAAPSFVGIVGTTRNDTHAARPRLLRIHRHRELPGGFSTVIAVANQKKAKTFPDWFRGCWRVSARAKKQGAGADAPAPVESPRLVIPGSKNNPSGDTRVVLGIALEMRGEILGLNQTNGHVLPNIPVQSAPKCPGKRIIRRAL